MCSRDVLIVLQWGLFCLFGACWTYPLLCTAFANVFHMKNLCLIKHFHGSIEQCEEGSWNLNGTLIPYIFTLVKTVTVILNSVNPIIVIRWPIGGLYSLQQSSEFSPQSLNGKTLALFHFTRARGKGRRDAEEILLQTWSGDHWDERGFSFKQCNAGYNHLLI